MMGLENPVHILFILAVVLMVFGAKRLPEMGRGLGEGFKGFKEAISGHGHSEAEIAPGPDATAGPAPAELTRVSPMEFTSAPEAVREPAEVR